MQKCSPLPLTGRWGLSPSLCQPYCVLLREMRLADALLYLGKVISYAACFPGFGFRVEDSVSRARVTVARLADRARVQDRAFGQGHRLSNARRVQRDAIALLVQLEHALDVGMSYKTPVGIEEIKIQTGGECINDVLPDRVTWAAVRHGDIAAHFWILRQRAQKIRVTGGQHAFVPDE